MLSLGAAGPLATSIAPRSAPIGAARPAIDWRLILSGLSSALPTIAASRANRDAQDDYLQGNAELNATQQRADAMLGDQITSVARSRPDEGKTLADYAGAIQRNRQASSSSAPAPQLSGEAAKEAKAASQEGAKYARQQATYAAGVDAPMRQREAEGIRANRVAGDLGGLRQEAGTSAFLARLRARNRTPNPWVSLISQLGTQIANNYEPGAR